LRRSIPVKRSAAAAVALAALVAVGCGAYPAPEPVSAPEAPSSMSLPDEPEPDEPGSDAPEPGSSEAPGSAHETVVDDTVQRIDLAPGVTGELTAGTWETGPAEWLRADSGCADLMVWEGREVSGSDGRASFWVYWRSDEALPWDQVSVADSYGEFGWATPADAALVDPDRLSMPTEWIEVVRYEQWPAPGSSTGPEGPEMIPAEGFAFVARTVAPAGYVGAGSIIFGEPSDVDHDPRRVLETLEFDLEALIGSCG